MRPGNMWIPDVNEVIKKNNLKQVTSLFIKEPSTNLFHTDGLFSEYIFGPLASQERMITFGFIDLKTNIIHPAIYERLIELNRFYEEILSGKSEAIWDNTINDFIRIDKVSNNLSNGLNYGEAGTGYSFFLKYLDKINFKKSDSLKRINNIEMVDKYKGVRIIDKFVVCPAGIRDYNIEKDKQQMEEVNQLYMNILISTFSFPTIKTEDPIWDSIRYNLQKKVVAVYQYFFNILNGKGGLIQKKYTARSVALGTRNVITGTKLASYSSKGDRHRADETRVPLFQAAKAFLPLVIHYMKILFFNPLLDNSSSFLHVIDPKTYDLIKLDIDETDKKSLISRDGMNDKIESFRTPEIRQKPLAIHKNGKYYYLYLVYDDEDEIHIFRNINEFNTYYKQLTNKDADKTKIRPMTNMEFLYICTDFACQNKHIQTTRYPVLGARNTYMSKTIPITTEPDRKVVVINTLSGQEISLPFFHFPVKEKDCVDGVRIHSSWLKNIGGDHDGDTSNNVSILTKNANEEIANYINSKKYFLTPTGKLKLTVSGSNSVMDITLKNLCLRTGNY